MINYTFSETPTLFGAVHISALILICAVNTAFVFYARNLDEERLLGILHKLGIAMLLAEVFKQWFCFKYVFGGELNLWFFPWQLCSMAMYLSFMAIYLKGKAQNAALVFLATYSLFADIIASLLPYDMLRPQIAIVIHSFAFHGLVITESIIAIAVLVRRNWKDAGFAPATMMFLVMAVVAEIINVTAHAAINDIRREPNLFYITPAYPTTQPILHDIAVKYGIWAEIILYLGLIIAAGYAVYSIERRISKS